ncbi:MAG: hypothetical protein OQK04_02095 [Kangiellaceae bacterium]|nr:hypothetical protein [Kangiellaceae bacterium]MCW8997493.1 hypothetical protein [Kangiellaceae bacterium]
MKSTIRFYVFLAFLALFLPGASQVAYSAEQHGEEVDNLDNGDETVQAGGQGTSASQTVATSSGNSSGQREQLDINFYVGTAFDSFAGKEAEFLNYDEKDDNKLRSIMGFIVDYNVSQTEDRTGLWLTARTSRGVRSGEVDCSAEDPEQRPSLCAQFNDVIDPVGSPERVKYLLKNSSSLETQVGLRWEFENPFTSDKSKSMSNVYVGYNLGSVAVKDDDDDLAKIESFNLGLIVNKGEYKGSFFDIGKGKNEIFEDHKDDRLKVNARLVKDITINKISLRAFIHLSVDADDGDGSDSMQTYVGFTVPIGDIFSSNNKSNN